MSLKKTAIIIEESKTIQLYFQNLISPLDYEVIAVKSFQELKIFFEKNKTTNINFVLISLDNEDKPEPLVDYVIKKKIPTILLSENEDELLRKKFLKKNIVDYINKNSTSYSNDVVELIKRLEINKNETILVVDDSALYRSVIKTLLTRHKFNVLEATDGQKALDILESDNNVKLVITDYEMPNLNGLELIKNARKTYDNKKLPIIVISSVDEQFTIIECMKHGANDYLNKPFSDEEFYSRIYLTLSYKENLDLLAEQKEVFETLFYQSSNATLLMEKGKYVDCNDAAIKLLNLKSKDQIINKTPLDFSPEFQPDGLSSVAKKEKLNQEKSTRFEWEFIKPDSQSLMIDVIRTPIPVKDKEVMHIVWHDITIMKKLEKELESLNIFLEERVKDEIKKNKEQSSHMLQQSRLAQMGEMISMIAHQWRQPLASISAITGTLTLDIMMEQYKADFFQDRLNSINELTQHLSSTIDDFRGFFKEEKSMQKTTLKDLVNGSSLIIGPTLKTKNIELKVDCDNDIIVNTYSNEVKQVILNILKNAEDIFSEKKIPNATIWIDEYQDDKYAYLSLKDNAGGVPDNIIGKIFDPYYSTKKSKEGTGLGLYMSKTIIEDHCHGNLTVHNTEDGAKFIIALPLNI